MGVMPTDPASTGQECGALEPGPHEYVTQQSLDGHLSTTVQIPVQQPFHGAALLEFLSTRAIAGVEAVAAGRYARTVRLPHGVGAIELTLADPALTDTAGAGHATAPARSADDGVTAQIVVTHPDDVAEAIDRCRHLLNADAPAGAIAEVLGSDPALRAAVQAAPGLRLPGTVDGPEILFRALVGQQISVAAARTKLARLTAVVGERVAFAEAPGAPDTQDLASISNPSRTPDPLRAPNPLPTSDAIGQLTHLFPSPAAIAALTQVGS